MIVYGLYTDDTNKKRFVSTLDTFDVAMGKIKSRLDEFNCTVEKKADHWVDPPAIQWYLGRRRSLGKFKDPDITYIGPGSYFLGPHAAELLRPVISDVAELLPVPFQGETWYFLNVFYRVNNALDKAHSRYLIYSTGEASRTIIEPAFFADKVPHAKLFMIPEARSMIYYAEHHPDNNPNTFRNIVEKNKLFGIKIEKVWEN